jgi:hypothetical protein
MEYKCNTEMSTTVQAPIPRETVMCASEAIYIYIASLAQIYMYIYTVYVYTYTHTHTHTHIYMTKQVFPMSPYNANLQT